MKKIILALLVFALIVPATSFAVAEPEISRAIFSTSLIEREPANDVEAVPHGEKSIFFFTEILNANATSVTHLWTYNDIEIARVKLNIGSDHWRTWSSKQIWHLTPGEVKVQVLDADNMILAEKKLTIAKKD
jgi:hypothetical protein